MIFSNEIKVEKETFFKPFNLINELTNCLKSEAPEIESVDPMMIAKAVLNLLKC